MAVILRFFFDRSSFYIYLVIGIIQVVVFLMLILSSRTQSQKKSKTTLMSAGIIGIILSVLYFCLPETFCTPPDYPFEGICLVSRMIQSLVYILPILISLGIPLLLVGLWNKAEYGIILMISGIVWIVAFIGFFLQESFLMPFIEIPNIVSLILFFGFYPKVY